MTFTDSEIEQQLVEALPELRPAAERYWEENGRPGSDPGPYVFVSSVLRPYLIVLAGLPASPRRDELLRRALAVVDQALVCGDGSVWSLVMDLYGGLSEHWYRAARSFVGPRSGATLDAFHAGWDSDSGSIAGITSEPDELFDFYRIQELIAADLRRTIHTPDSTPP